MAALLFPVMGMFACKKDFSSQPAGQVLNTGKWKLTYYYDKDEDETYKFAAYEFAFNNGTVTATNGNNTVSGTYVDQGSDDSTPKLILNFGGTSPFDDLNDDWHVTEKTNAAIKLEDQSGSGGTEYLNFNRK